jgi:hypothetical protein
LDRDELMAIGNLKTEGDLRRFIEAELRRPDVIQLGNLPGLSEGGEEATAAVEEERERAEEAEEGKQPLSSVLTALAATTPGTLGKKLLEAATALKAREELGLGTAATQASSAFDAAGAAATEETRAKAAEAEKRPLIPRVKEVASAAKPEINVDEADQFNITALATAIESFTTNLKGTPHAGQKLIIRILDNGTARAITWGASFASRGATLPTTTVLGKYLYVGLIQNAKTSTWDCVATSQES